VSYLRFLVRRAAFAVLTVYAVVTAMFFLVNTTVWLRLENRVARAEYGGASPEEIEQLREGFISARNLDVPIYDRYVGWLIDVPKLDWGYSFAYREPVIKVLDGRVPKTLEYVIPGVLIAVVLGVLIGLFAALSKDGLFDWSTRLGSYVLLGIPAFMVVIYYVHFLGPSGRGTGLDRKLVASVAVAVGLLAGQIRFSRASALEQTGQSFVKMLRAKGANRLRMARHVLRNAAIPIVSLSLTELLAVLMLNIYVVEEVLNIRGLAQANLLAVRESDISLVIWSAMVFVVIGVVGNFLQDVLYGWLDPRIRAE
jgi:peptide/nickel transport system permease protein